MESPGIPSTPFSRREFITLLSGAGIALCSGCACPSPGGSPVSPGTARVVDAGPVQAYAFEGIYSTFRDQGFFLIRHQGKLVALSSICTHRNCLLDSEPDRSFYCDCHGSSFSPEGIVTHGPATRNLPLLSTTISPGGHLLVSVPATA